LYSLSTSGICYQTCVIGPLLGPKVILRSGELYQLTLGTFKLCGEYDIRRVPGACVGCERVLDAFRPGGWLGQGGDLSLEFRDLRFIRRTSGWSIV
jgi:hypothetical protein